MGESELAQLVERDQVCLAHVGGPKAPAQRRRDRDSAQAKEPRDEYDDDHETHQPDDSIHAPTPVCTEDVKTGVGRRTAESTPRRLSRDSIPGISRRVLGAIP